MMKPAEYRAWDYATKGDYHKNLDLGWPYAPTYLSKMKHVRHFIESLPHSARILDAGCGEGVLVEEYRSKGRCIDGVDLNYESKHVFCGNILALPFSDHVYDVVLCLDVFEHIAFKDQPACLKEMKRVLNPGEGQLLISIPNLAHLNSRLKLLFQGKLDRSDIETNHIGERPLAENIKLLRNAGFEIVRAKGITLTVPVLYRHVVCRRPAQFRWLHDFLEPLAVPSLAMLNIFLCKVRR